MMANTLYDKMFEDAPTVAPYGPESFSWLGTKLTSFGTERLVAAGELAMTATEKELQDPKSLRDLLGLIWDAVSLELDDGQISEKVDAELTRMETHLAQSVHVLRPVVGY